MHRVLTTELQTRAKMVRRYLKWPTPPGQPNKIENKSDSQMLLKLAEELALNATVEEVWKLLRDTPRLTSLLPGVENVAALQEEGVEAYAARVSEKVGPFKLTMNLKVRVMETAEPSLL